jgi:hypothetical protein
MILSVAFILMTAAGDASADLKTLHTQVDARRLQTGESVYQDSANGKVTGSALDRRSSLPKNTSPRGRID